MNSLCLLLAHSLSAAGVFFILVAAIGVLRLPDMLCRAHAVAKALTLGIMLVLAGAAFHAPMQEVPKYLIAIFFQFLTIPVAGHLVSLVAYRKRYPRWTNDTEKEP